MIEGRIERLRALMKENGLWAYYVPTDDHHLSEYVNAYFKARQFMTGFTGSAGTLIVTQEEACLWVDSRYFIQSEKQTAGTSIKLMKMGTEGTPTVEEYLSKVMPENSVLGFDGRTVSAKWAMRIERILSTNDVMIEPQWDLVGKIWEDRPALPWSKVWVVDEKYVGESAASKLAMVRRAMEKRDADVHVLASLDDIAWLLNIRGDDVPCNPVVLSYLVVERKDKAYLFVEPSKLDESTRSYLDSLNIEVQPYEDVYTFIERYDEGTSVLLSAARINYMIYDILARDAIMIDSDNPTLIPKAIKNEVEVENMRRAHIKDGVVITRFMKWIKDNVGKIPMDELMLADKLDAMRAETEGCLGNSFGTISAYGPNAAMPHYSARPDDYAVVEPKGFYLVDSGGQYYEGTTDITRTIAVGPLTDEEKYHFALVLRGMLDLANARFLHGARGANLDILCRAPLWEVGVDYKHGTGHGVGYLLNVHEGPNSFRWQLKDDKTDSVVLEEGMITSDEPGLYFEGSHGIRTENLVVCRKGEKNEFGQFMYFEQLTCAPVDLDAVDPAYLSDRDKKRLNEYHEFVYEKLSPYMEGEELEWLRKYTRAI